MLNYKHTTDWLVLKSIRLDCHKMSHILSFISQTHELHTAHIFGNLISFGFVSHADCLFVPREGEKWYNLRAMLNKRMLHPKDSAQYDGVINDVVTDFMKRIYLLRQGSTTGDLVTDVANELYHFSLEGI